MIGCPIRCALYEDVMYSPKQPLVVSQHHWAGMIKTFTGTRVAEPELTR
jgi:hypothetical protein